MFTDEIDSMQSLESIITYLTSLPNSKALIPSEETLRAKLTALQASGPSDIEIVTDFDYTLSRYETNGTRNLTGHGLLEVADAIPPEVLHSPSFTTKPS